MLYFSKWKTFWVLALCALGVLFALPNVLPQHVREQYPSWFPARTIVLGLDLQGGVQLLLEGDAEKFREERRKQLIEDVRRVLVREGRIGTASITQNGDTVRATLRNASDMQAALDKLKTLAVPSTASAFGAPAPADVDVAQDGPTAVTARLNQLGLTARVRAAVQQSLEVVRKRVDILGTTEPSIQQQGTDRILVQVPGYNDPSRLKAILGETAKMEFRLVDLSMPVEQALAGRPPEGSEILQEDSGGGQTRPILVEKRVMVSGADVTGATPGFDQRTREPIVQFQFNNQGARAFGAVTTANVGKPFAIILNGKVISAPRINEPITGGSGQISGSFTVESANDLSIQLRSGALPIEFKVAEERTVGPGLGQDSIEAGTKATLYAAVFVVLFMFATYGVFGFIANIALTIHVVFIFALMSLLGATLTLPGIAGIVLTIGTAVDSNVLIYERIREEFKTGRSMVSAIEAGFNHAFAVIIDSNSTMGIAAVILFLVGSGPVKGFAVVFILGILTTVITAVTMTRMMIALWYRRSRPQQLPF